MARRRTKPKARILVVDDDKSMLELLKLHLSNAGYDVVEKSVVEHVLVVPVPVALEQLFRVVLALELEEVGKLRVAGVDLATQRVPVIRRIPAAAVLDAQVDQAAELVAGADQAARGVLDVQVEDDAGVGLTRPGEEALLVLLDEPHRAGDDLHLLAARIAGDLGHERRQRVALAENLGDR